MRLTVKFCTVILIFVSVLNAQQEVKVKIDKGVSAISVAMPDFTLEGVSETNRKEAREIYRTIWRDLEYSRVFRMIPKEHYSLIKNYNPEDIRFSEWSSIQASFLLTCKLEFIEGKRLVFAFKLYNVNTSKFVFGKSFGGKTSYRRLIAHRAADTVMKFFGEKSYFTSKIVFVSNRDKNKEIYIMDYDGKRQKRITYNRYIDLLPSWSTDNNKILYTSYRKNNPDLYAFHLYEGRTELIASGGANYSADWSVEENKVIYTSTRSGNAEIYIKNMDTLKTKRLTFNPAIDTSPSWSYNGREVAFTSQRSGSPQIYLMDAEGTNVRRITYEGTYHDSPTWSPDNTRIAYVSRIEARFDIYVYDLRTNTIIKLTENCGRNENPTWSPDGRHIVFASNRGGSYQLYSVDFDGGNLTRLTRHGNNRMPRWQKIIKQD